VNLRDVTERKCAELELSRLALHDPLTGLPNRVRLLERIAAVLRTGAPGAAVLFCDLDGFKAVNDRYGHDLGDRLLIAVADRLREALRGEDEATRLGGDEFVIVCSGVTSDAHVRAIADRLRSRICEPFALRGVEVRIGCSIGIATADRPGVRPEDLLEAADRAMYRAKRLRRGIAMHRWADTRTVDLTVTVAEPEEVRAQAVRG
jgi:diguanylate cyclase (GGDEF)-like protein